MGSGEFCWRPYTPFIARSLHADVVMCGLGRG